MARQKLESAFKPKGRQKTKGHGKKTKLSGSTYRSSNYRNQSGYECYARSVNGGKRELLTPEDLADRQYRDGNGAYASIASHDGAVKDKPAASDTGEYRGTVPSYVKAKNESRSQYRNDTDYDPNRHHTVKVSMAEDVPTSRPEIPHSECPWIYRESKPKWIEHKTTKVNKITGRIEHVSWWEKKTTVKDQPAPGYSHSGLKARQTGAEVKPQRSDKASVGKPRGYPLENERYPRVQDKVR